MKPRLLPEWQVRMLLNYYPPLFFQRVRTMEIGAGCRSCTVQVKRSLWNRNLQGTTFGGSIFAGADPFYAILYWQVFARRGERVRVWLKSAAIDYLKPARSTLTLRFALSDADVDDAVAALDREGRFARTFTVDAVDEDGITCAVVTTEVYLRRPRGDQDEVRAF